MSDHMVVIILPIEGDKQKDEYELVQGLISAVLRGVHCSINKNKYKT